MIYNVHYYMQKCVIKITLLSPAITLPLTPLPPIIVLVDHSSQLLHEWHVITHLAREFGRTGNSWTLRDIYVSCSAGRQQIGKLLGI